MCVSSVVVLGMVGIGVVGGWFVCICGSCVSLF